jgi:hypothetical protein
MSRILTTVLLALALPACSNPTYPSAPTQTTPPARFPDLKEMAGTYTLTIDLDEGCNAMPAAARHRVYQARLEDRGWHFLVVSIAGGGFSETTQLGDLFSGELGAVQRYDPRLKWNSFDIGCDVREPLADGGELAVCGDGPIARSEGMLSGAVKGYAFIARGNAVVARCEGVHQFSFEPLAMRVR